MTHTAAVIGGGPAGLMAAEILAQAGIAVTIYDQMPSIGRKLLMAGRGGLNLTHTEPMPVFLSRYGAAGAWIEPIIAAFPPEALIAWCNSLGQPTFTGSSARVFPTAMKSSPLLRAWLRRLADLGVQLRVRHRWTGWDNDGNLCFSTPFDISRDQTVRDQTARDGTAGDRPDVTILAMGGASWPRLGSDGDWVPILSNAVTPFQSELRAALGSAWDQVISILWLFQRDDRRSDSTARRPVGDRLRRQLVDQG